MNRRDFDHHGRGELDQSAPAPDAVGETVSEASAAPTSKLSEDAATRRRLLKAGLIAIPMITTLRSRPAHAAPSLGSLGIFYGQYDMIEENGQEVWAPVDQQGNVVRDEFGNIDFTRRAQQND